MKANFALPSAKSLNVQNNKLSRTGRMCLFGLYYELRHDIHA